MVKEALPPRLPTLVGVHRGPGTEGVCGSWLISWALFHPRKGLSFLEDAPARDCCLSKVYLWEVHVKLQMHYQEQAAH